MTANEDRQSREHTSRSEPQHVILPEDLNLLGRAVYVAGTVIGIAARTAGTALERAQSIWVASEKAFSAEMDDCVEDARIIEEVDRDQT